jgi:hypothetical protein
LIGLFFFLAFLQKLIRLIKTINKAIFTSLSGLFGPFYPFRPLWRFLATSFVLMTFSLNVISRKIVFTLNPPYVCFLAGGSF